MINPTTVTSNRIKTHTTNPDNKNLDEKKGTLFPKTNENRGGPNSKTSNKQSTEELLKNGEKIEGDSFDRIQNLKNNESIDNKQNTTTSSILNGFKSFCTVIGKIIATPIVLSVGMVYGAVFGGIPSWFINLNEGNDSWSFKDLFGDNQTVKAFVYLPIIGTLVGLCVCAFTQVNKIWKE